MNPAPAVTRPPVPQTIILALLDTSSTRTFLPRSASRNELTASPGEQPDGRSNNELPLTRKIAFSAYKSKWKTSRQADVSELVTTTIQETNAICLRLLLMSQQLLKQHRRVGNSGDIIAGRQHPRW